MTTQLFLTPSQTFKLSGNGGLLQLDIDGLANMFEVKNTQRLMGRREDFERLKQCIDDHLRAIAATRPRELQNQELITESKPQRILT